VNEISAPAPPDYWRLPLHQGPGYDWVLRQIHVHLRPQTYLEIGTLAGKTLKLASAASIAVDPSFQIQGDVVGDKPACHLMRMTSDAFFAGFDPAALLGGPVDFAFLDGMHLYQFLLRDFLNTERACRRNSVIALHDCLPTDSYVARREQSDVRHQQLTHEANWWAGDVWKAAALLRAARPDLRMYGVAAPPTGLILITNLDPQSTRLEEDYFAATARFAQADRSVYAGLLSTLEMIEPAVFNNAEGVAQYFWL
jgi:hypothetical protein